MWAIVRNIQCKKCYLRGLAEDQMRKIIHKIEYSNLWEKMPRGSFILNALPVMLWRPTLLIVFSIRQLKSSFSP